MTMPLASPLRRLAVAILLCAPAALPLPLLAYDTIEQLLDRSEPEGNGEELVSVLQELRRNPVPINTATEERLLAIPLLTAAEAVSIIDWRRRHGAIGSETELAAVIGADSARRLSPYVSFIVPKALVRKVEERGLQGSVIGRVLWESPPRKGIETGKYAGDNRHAFSRIQVGTPACGVTLLQDSDIGEQDIDDFVAFSLYAQKIGMLTQAVAGNYRLSFGQGLLVGQGRFFSKGTDAIDGVLLFAPALRPYTSAGESGFMQGAAVTIAPGAFEITAFTSDDRLDATISDGGVASGISETGYHRTVSELDKKDKLGLKVEGLNLRYRYRSGEVGAGMGATLLDYRYALPLESGNRSARLGSIEASAVYRKLQVFGETAFTRDLQALSWICGVQSELSKGITGVFSMRRYAPDYYSPFAGAFAEKGESGTNEEGYYLGLRAKVLPNLTLSSSYDIFRFPELDRDSYPLPSSGHDARLYVTWKQGRSLTWDAMYQHKEKEETLIQTESGEIYRYVMTVPKTTNRVQLTLTGKLSQRLDLRSASAYKSCQSSFAAGSETDEGWLLFQQVNYRIAPITVKSRFAFFNTDSYDAALYAYEDDLPLVYTLNAYYGCGKAFFILLDYEAAQDFNLTAKYEVTWYSDRDVYGSGNDLRDTSAPGSVHIGVMWKF